MQTRSMFIAALVAAGAMTVNAQTPERPQQPPDRPQQQQPTPRPTGDTTQRSTTGTDQVITITGCLKDAKDVPGHTATAGRAGADGDYIITSVKMAQSSAASGMGLGSMYTVQGVSGAELKKHLNHQVEVTGRLSSAAGATGATGAAGTQPRTTPGGTTPGAAGAEARTGASDHTPDFQATSVKMVSATCPAQ